MNIINTAHVTRRFPSDHTETREIEGRMRKKEWKEKEVKCMKRHKIVQHQRPTVKAIEEREKKKNSPNKLFFLIFWIVKEEIFSKWKGDFHLCRICIDTYTLSCHIITATTETFLSSLPISHSFHSIYPTKHIISIIWHKRKWTKE